MKFTFLALLLVLISGCTGFFILEEKEGPFKVVNVVDGDTLDINNSQRIRLSGINTPETGECYYKEATEKLKELVLNKEIILEKDITNTDRYGRLLRYIYTNNLFINSILVEEGYAKVYDKYKDDTKKYNELKKVEVIAKDNNLGVWSCINPQKDCLYVASKNSKIYHQPDCKWAKRIKPENLICFKSIEEVNELDLEPAKSC